MTFINKIIELGANHAKDSETIKKVILVNKIALVFICAAIPFMISIYIANLKVLTLIVPFIILFFIATVFLNKFGKFTTSKLVFYLSILASVYFYAAVLGKHSGVQYVYLSLIGFGFGIFDSKQNKLRYFLSIQPIIFFLLLYVTNFSFFYKKTLTETELAPIFFTCIILIFIIIWITILFFDQFSTHYKNNLKDILLTYQLSEREGDVFIHVLNGKSNKSISNFLYIEEGTVKNHLTNIYKKLGVKNRNELMAKFTK